MRRVLIIDDEKYAVEGLKRCVDWERLGVSPVLGVYSRREAEAVLAAQDVDVIICDIEMPQGSGLDLVTWVAENKPGVDSIFLTCHADFSYAQRALRLGGFDYLLKPVPYAKLEEVLERLFQKREGESAEREGASRGELWRRHRSELAEGFWLGLAERRVAGSAEELLALAEENGTAIPPGASLQPVLISIRSWTEGIGENDRRLLEFAVRKATDESCAQAGIDARSAVFGEGKLLFILVLAEGCAADRSLFERIISYCGVHFYCKPSCYLGRVGDIVALTAGIGELRRLEANSFARKGEVLAAGSCGDEPEGSAFPDTMLWAMMLASGGREAVQSEALAYIERLSRRGSWKAATLHRFRQDFSQAVYSILKSKRVPVHELFDDPESIALERRATDSLADLAAWVGHLLDGAGRKMDELEKSGTPFGRASRYISRHLTENLSCSSIAEHVSLNPDYLSRLFKKETGLSVSEYILGERMKMARDLLEKTNLPVGEIASRIGYTNFSHFSETFRKTEGVNPSRYRAERCAGKPDGG